jgi:multimeric flavodoxin WrbA
VKVVAVNSSPKMGAGNTALVLDPFLEGVRQAGAEVELFYTAELDIRPCQGEFHCWLKTPGTCFQRDDMQTLLPKLAEADAIVLGTPVHADGVAGPMKILLDRVTPLMAPFFELRHDHCRHSRRDGRTDVKLILVANCGFWEMDNFDPLLVHIEAVCKNLNCRFAGALLRPHGPALQSETLRQEAAKGVLRAAREAGRQLVEEGRIAPETLRNVSQDLVSREAYAESINGRLRELLGAPELAAADESGAA